MEHGVSSIVEADLVVVQEKGRLSFQKDQFCPESISSCNMTMTQSTPPKLWQNNLG